ncbi:citrate synthase [Halorarum salinum]|uniref:Citrate synthase n=1 Tax=Halorarum salinum TaxID=2743089 RepID=A0A7D5Q7I5_9EURY|nr:citrate synthase [Halobaculum salinum]QLG60277.1 citrate synthase [Halobaculum salinum]
MSEKLEKGLEGVLVAESELSYVDGEAGRLIYRGYDIEDLTRNASYEEVLYLLWYGHLPDQSELESFASMMSEERSVDDEILEIVSKLAAQDEKPMNVLRTAVSMLSAYDSDKSSYDPNDEEAILRKGRRLAAKFPTIIAAYNRFREGQDLIEPRKDLDHAENFLYLLNGEEPDDVIAETFDMALVLHADHGFNASTFSALATASTLSDVHSAVTSAVGTLGGALHGGANQDVMRMLKEVDEVDQDSVEWVETGLKEGRRIPGFGHRVYRVKDPRAKILSQESENLSEAAGDAKWFEMSVAIEEYMTEHTAFAPNVDFYSASMYSQMGIPIDLYTPIFAMSRVGGWVAHVSEYLDDNRLIRPRARYVGPKDVEFVPLEER